MAPLTEFVIPAKAGIQGAEGWHKWRPNGSNNQPTGSYLGVPTRAGMSDCYESIARTPIRDSFPSPDPTM